MNTPKTSAAANAKTAYATELRKIQSALNTLRARLEDAIGDGTLSDKIHWSNVADLEHMNTVLAQVLEMDLSRIA
ncbi:MAG: hypothetical protein AAB354_04080 [candidate division KSB1 bacterium]